MVMPFYPTDWYWIVAGSTTQVYSTSSVNDFVPVADAKYQAWLASGGKATKIGSESELGDVLAKIDRDDVIRPNAANVLDAYKDVRSVIAANKEIYKFIFNLNNRVRVLEGNSQLTPAQFLAIVKATM